MEKQERISVECKPPAYSLNRQKHRQMDRRTDRQTDTQTDRRTDMTENITYPHTRVVKRKLRSYHHKILFFPKKR